MHCNIKQGYLQRQPDDELLLLVVDLPVVQEQLEVAVVEAEDLVQLETAPSLEIRSLVFAIAITMVVPQAVSLRVDGGVKDHRLHQRRTQIHLFSFSLPSAIDTVVVVALVQVLRENGDRRGDCRRGHRGVVKVSLPLAHGYVPPIITTSAWSSQLAPQSSALSDLAEISSPTLTTWGIMLRVNEKYRRYRLLVLSPREEKREM